MPWAALQGRRRPLRSRPPTSRFLRTRSGSLVNFLSPNRFRSVRTDPLDGNLHRLGPILSPGAAVRHFQNASRCRSGLPGAEKHVQSSGLQRICCILSETHGSGAVAQNGLGLGGWLLAFAKTQEPPTTKRALRMSVGSQASLGLRCPKGNILLP